MIIRNDDVAFDTDIAEFKWFCDLCDEYGHKIMQCITPLGICIPIHVNMSNDDIVKLGGHRTIFHNQELHEYLGARLERGDLIAVHGLWHTHVPTITDIWTCKVLLEEGGLPPTYFVPPFNEGSYPSIICGLKLCQKTDSLENCINMGIMPTTDIVYLHSWRFSNKQFTHRQLKDMFERLK